MHTQRQPGDRTTRTGLGVLLLAVGLGTGCTAAAAPVLPTGMPALNAPEPPPRIVVPAPEPVTLTPEPPAQPPVTDPPVRPSRDPETPPPSKPVPTRPPTEPPATQNPPPVLRTRTDTAEYEKHVRAQLTLAQADLSRVSRLGLGPEARAQYDSAAGFIRQAEQALKVKNLVYAGQLADKAATMAALLRR